MLQDRVLAVDPVPMASEAMPQALLDVAGVDLLKNATADILHKKAPVQHERHFSYPTKTVISPECERIATPLSITDCKVAVFFSVPRQDKCSHYLSHKANIKTETRFLQEQA